MTASIRVDAVLFDRDGTLIVDVPDNGDPAAVRTVAGARRAVDRVRRAGLPAAIVTNQSGLARGRFGERDLDRVHARVDELLGPFAAIEHCPHGPEAGCGCRKPRPGLVLAAAARIGIDPRRCLVVGDTAADLGAAEAAGAIGVLVPNERTRRDEVTAAPRVAADLAEAVDRWALGPPTTHGQPSLRSRPQSRRLHNGFGGKNGIGPVAATENSGLAAAAVAGHAGWQP
jgi:D-glycero-D-manno-heptose 1,7-bisphosphate phosphatase